MNTAPEFKHKPKKLTKGPHTFMEKFNSLCDAIKEIQDIFLRDRVIAGTNLSESQSAQGRLWKGGAGGSGADTTTSPPFTVVDASAVDKAGNPHPGRVRVYNGKLAGLLPAEMNLLDVVLPDGTDNHCYLTLQNGTNYVSGKVAVDGTTGLFTEAHVYVANSPENYDGTNVYLDIATLLFDGTTITLVSQDASGNQSLAVLCSADGTILTPIWSSNG